MKIYGFEDSAGSLEPMCGEMKVVKDDWKKREIYEEQVPAETYT